MKMQVLDLFSGIGGFSLGLESTGLFETVAFCEKEEFPKRVLKKHWPHLPIHEDVHHVSGYAYRGIDLIAGGFPCQPVSVAGARKGKEDERWLWPQFHRVIEEARPRWCLIENVPGLRTRHADDVLGDLEESGYTCWPLVVGAGAAGATHQRKRVWMVAHAQCHQLRSKQRWSEPERPGAAELGDDGEKGLVAHSNSMRLEKRQGERGDAREEQSAVVGNDRTGLVAHLASERFTGRGLSIQPRRQKQASANIAGSGWCCDDPDHWRWERAPVPVLLRVDDGLPRGVDRCGRHRRQRITVLGNAVVPQIVAALGQAIWWMEVTGNER